MNKLIKILIVGSICAAATQGVGARIGEHEDVASQEDDYQLRRLMAPTPGERASEEKGRVQIYDQLGIDQVNGALDANFERIQSMMFTRIHHPPDSDDGRTEVEDDGCD